MFSKCILPQAALYEEHLLEWVLWRAYYGEGCIRHLIGQLVLQQHTALLVIGGMV